MSIDPSVGALVCFTRLSQVLLTLLLLLTSLKVNGHLGFTSSSRSPKLYSAQSYRLLAEIAIISSRSVYAFLPLSWHNSFRADSVGPSRYVFWRCLMAIINPTLSTNYNAKSKYFAWIIFIWACLFLMFWLSEGELLATMEKNSRDFLYPDLTVFDREGKSEQEAFMKRSPTFPVSCVSFVSNVFPSNTAHYF